MAYETSGSVLGLGPKYASNPDMKEGLASPPNVDTKPDAELEAPEGGTKAWLSLLGASCAMFVSFGWVNCIALFQAQYETDQLKQYSKSTVSWITSMECESSFSVLLREEQTANSTKSSSCSSCLPWPAGCSTATARVYPSSSALSYTSWAS
jgi:hypothetical protein